MFPSVRDYPGHKSNEVTLTLPSLRRNTGNDVMLKQADRALVTVELNITLRAQGGVSGNGDSEKLAVRDQSFLGEVRVQLDLEHLRLDASVAHDVMDQRTLAVARKAL